MNLFKGTVSRDKIYSIFFSNQILLILQEVLYEDVNFDKFAQCYSTIMEVADVDYNGRSGLPGVAYTGEY